MIEREPMENQWLALWSSQDVPKTPQEALKTSQDASKTPKALSRCLKTPPIYDFAGFREPKWSHVGTENHIQNRLYPWRTWKEKNDDVSNGISGIDFGRRNTPTINWKITWKRTLLKLTTLWIEHRVQETSKKINDYWSIMSVTFIQDIQNSKGISPARP